MNRTLPALTLAALWLVGVDACLAACSDSSSSPSPASPSSPVNALKPYFVTGVVTDAVSHTAIRGALVEVFASPIPTPATTDNTGGYTVSGLPAVSVYRVRVSAIGYGAREQIVYVIAENTRVDFELSPPVTPSANYEGVWTGDYRVTDCRDIDVPGLTQFHLCGMARTQFYEFTLTQTGTIVSGTYKLVSSFYSCPCQLNGGYGEIPMSGSISPDGTLTITALGNTRGLVGATAELDLVLRQATSSTITGTGTIHLRYGTTDDRSVGSVVVRSGTRTQ
jgi:Carboxypeptidase regulatory-like domain